MKSKTLLTYMALLIAGNISVSAASPSILSIRDSLHTMPVVYPESFETDVHKMQENWYLRTYADIDRNADSRSSVNVSDDVIIDRLGKLPTVIELPFNSVVRNYIDMYADRRKQLVENMLGMSLYYMPIFEQALDRYGLPMELKYLPVIESALNPDAVSRVGATGLWQFMIPTATGEGLEVNSIVDQRRDPYASSDAAARYLKKLYDIYKDWSLAIAAYNCGPGNVNKAMRRLPANEKKDFWQLYPFLPSETRGYIPAFIAANYIMNYYDKHNISPALARKPIVTDTIHVTRRIHFQQISDVMNIPMEELRVLNPQYRTDLIPGDIRPYTLVLPSLQVYAYVANEDSIAAHNAALYARRDVVEPGTSQIVNTDSKGRYVLETRVVYHTVKKGETLAKIANKYGVTQASIRQNNKIGKNVSRGKKLKIVITERKYIDEEAAPQGNQPIDSVTVAQTDSISVNVPAATDTVAVTTSVSAESQRVGGAITRSQNSVPAQTAPAQTRPAQQRSSGTSNNQSSARTHTVRRGENLSKIAAKYGVTIDAIRSANNLRGDRIDVGQKLKIPAKKSSSRRKK